MSIRRSLIWILAGGCVLLLGLIVCGLALDAGYLRAPLIALLEADTHRHIEVDGSLEAHVFSRHPRFVAGHVKIGNPSWMPAGVTAYVDRLTLDLVMLGNTGLLRVDGLVLEGAMLSLVRNVDGNANWQLSKRPHGDGLPLIRGLSMPKAHATLADVRHHLSFDGIVSVQSLTGEDGIPWLQISGDGRLNQVDIAFQTLSDPLASANGQRPYHFSYAERSASSRLSGHGSLAHAFDFDHLQTTFDAVGANMKDLYALVGINLINTGDYHLSGHLERRDAVSKFTDLAATSGTSDMMGSLSVDSSGDRPRLSGDLQSRQLRLADLGIRAARHESSSQYARPFLLSNAALNPSAVRHGEANVHFNLQRVEFTRMSLQGVAGTLTIDHGILTLAPVTGAVLDGLFTGRWQMDATSDNPLNTLHLAFRQLQLGQLDHPDTGGPHYDALVNAQLDIQGHGSSLHQIGASANGHISARLLRGTLRQSLAEFSGMDLRGWGLMLTRSQQQTEVRCGAADIEAHDGTLSTEDLLIETSDVRITGEGNAHLDTEALHLALRGHPKETRFLRVKAPVLIGGTLLHPHFGLEQPKSLQLIDRGSTSVVDCQALLAR